METGYNAKINCTVCVARTTSVSPETSTGEDRMTNCLVCEAEVEYLNKAIKGRCYYCGNEEEAYFLCMNGHYVCNRCHSADAVSVISNVCLSTEGRDPFEIAEKIMEHSSVHMHGPEHHILVPAVLVTVCRNLKGEDREDSVLEAIKRGRTVPGGYCGLYGACGAAIGVGIAVSVLLGATPLTPEKRSHANLATSKTLNSIAEAGGARCCKKATRLALEEGMDYLSGFLDLEWEMPVISGTCTYMEYNRECDPECRFRKKD